MSWCAYLHDDRGHEEGTWGYTHNTSQMIYAVLRDAGIELAEHESWWQRLNGMSGEDGRTYLTTIVRGLEGNPARFRAMDPPNGWGDYPGLLGELRDMRDRVPTDWPSEWTASG